MIRILHIVSKMDRGGLETFIMNIYRNIDRNKLQFDFLVHTEEKGEYDDEIRSMGGNIYFVPPRSQGVLLNHKSLDQFFGIHKEYRIVHQHVSSLSYIEPLKMAKRHGIQVRIIHGHSTKQRGNYLHTILHIFNRKYIKNYATNYFACSDLSAKWLFNNKINNISIINNGIQTEKFTYSENNRREKRRILRLDDKFVVGHVGRFSYPKNHDFLIDIFKEIHDQNADTILLLVGDGELRSDIEHKCKRLGIYDNVIFAGVRSDIAEVLQAMDVFVFPSHYEGLPVSLIEAQASGLMCFISDNITKQVHLTSKVYDISIQKPASYWAELILSRGYFYLRKDTSVIVKEMGFDSKSVSSDLTDFYIRRL